MDSTFTMLFFLTVGLLIGLAVGWLLRGQRNTTDSLLAALHRKQAETSAQERDALTSSVGQSLAPLEKAVAQLQGQVHHLELKRAESQAALTAQVQAMNRTSMMLSDRTDKLVTALRAPQTRGRWGEMQLERVVELSGMVKHCDFDVQVTASGIRPDMVVRLSDGRNVIVDAKAPFVAYLDALETTDPEEHAGHLRRHAYHLRSHVTQLASKDYLGQFRPTPEFVVLFVPADPFLDAALSVDNELLEFAFSKNIVLATPTTLIALLRTIGLSWQQSALSDQAREIQRLGAELYQRLGTVGEHLNRLGTHLDKTVVAFNQTIASLDSRVLVTARKLHDLDVLPHSVPEPPEVEAVDVRSRTSGLAGPTES